MKVSLITLIFLFLVSPYIFAEDSLYEAHKHYEEGHYEEALKIYTTVSQESPNGHIYYNIGNCYFRLNEIGKAIHYYKKAQKLIPRDPELRANLPFVRGKTEDKIEDRAFGSITRKLFFWYYLFNFKTLVIITLIINFLLFSFLFLRYLKPNQELLQWSSIILFVFTIIFISTSVVKYYDDYRSRDGVIITAETEVRSGYGIGSSVLFKLHEGAEFSLLEESNDWVKIELVDGKKGWVKESDVIHE